jgi:hypothetical protein
MEIPVLVESTSTGFRASTQSPLTLSAEGATESAAIAALTVVMSGQLPNGGKIRMITLPEPETLPEIWERMRTNPVHAEMEKAIADYRKVANAVPEAD